MFLVRDSKNFTEETEALLETHISNIKILDSKSQHYQLKL
jgi:hypothetical protein